MSLPHKPLSCSVSIALPFPGCEGVGVLPRAALPTGRFPSAAAVTLSPHLFTTGWSFPCLDHCMTAHCLDGPSCAHAFTHRGTARLPPGLARTSKAPGNILLRSSWGEIRRRGTPGRHGEDVSSLVRRFQTIFPSGCALVLPQQSPELLRRHLLSIWWGPCCGLWLSWSVVLGSGVRLGACVAYARPRARGRI